MQRIVYKVCTAAEWQMAGSGGIYAGSADDRRDGFIHLSTAAQLEGTLARYFAGRADLVLVAFASASLGDRLKWEPSRGGQLFPHLYAPLDPELASRAEPLPMTADGSHALPQDLDRDPDAC